MPVPPLHRSHHHGAAGKVSLPSSSPAAPTLPRCLISTASTLLNRNTSQATPLPLLPLNPAEISEHSLLNSETWRARDTSDLSLVPPSHLSPLPPFQDRNAPDTFSHMAATGIWKKISNCTPVDVKAVQRVLHTRATTTLSKLTFVPKQLLNALSSTNKPQRAQSCSIT